MVPIFDKDLILPWTFSRVMWLCLSAGHHEYPSHLRMVFDWFDGGQGSRALGWPKEEGRKIGWKTEGLGYGSMV